MHTHMHTNIYTHIHIYTTYTHTYMEVDMTQIFLRGMIIVKTITGVFKDGKK